MTTTKLISTRDVAARKGVTVKTVNIWASTGKLPIAETEAVSGARLFDPEVVDTFTPKTPGKAPAGSSPEADPAGAFVRPNTTQKGTSK